MGGEVERTHWAPGPPGSPPPPVSPHPPTIAAGGGGAPGPKGPFHHPPQKKLALISGKMNTEIGFIIYYMYNIDI
jgi:hypothetical protein